MMVNGFYAIFEGNDGVGKTTIMAKAAQVISERLAAENLSFNIMQTHQPGSTPLGKHIRQLVKFPHTIDKEIQIDDLSRQLLYMVDAVNYITTSLRPSLNNNKIVFSDRSTHITAMVYGLSDGLLYDDVCKLLSLIDPPMADKLIVFDLPAEVSQQRLLKDRQINGTDDNGELDHYDKKALDFFKRTACGYRELKSGTLSGLASKTVKLSDVSYINADQTIDAVVNDVVAAIWPKLIDKISS